MPKIKAPKSYQILFFISNFGANLVPFLTICPFISSIHKLIIEIQSIYLNPKKQQFKAVQKCI